MKQALVVLGRYPHPGKVKTRLAKNLGEEKAMQVYRQLTEKLLSEVGALDEVKIYFCYADLADKALMQDWLGEDISLIDPVSMDIEANISHSFEKLFGQRFEKVMCVGSDIPDLDAELISQAFAKLEKFDVVIGSDLSGGIYLFGSNAFDSEFFAAQEPLSAFEKTIKLCKTKKIKYFLTQALLDIDTVQDYNKWQSHDLS